MKTFIRITALSAFLFVFSTCMFGQISAEIEGFNKVDIFGKLNVRLEKSNNDSLFIQSASFDITQVKFFVEDSVLIIKLLTEFPPDIKVDLTVNFQQINGLIVGGGAKVYNKGAIETNYFELSGNSGCELDLLAKIDSLKVTVTKGAFVRLTGENRYMNLKINSGGDFRSTKMTNNITEAKMSGGSAEISCSDLLIAKVCLSASLKCVELPKRVVKKEKLGGKVEKLEAY